MTENKKILRKAGSFGFVTAFSRITGLIRDIAFAFFFGTNIYADAFLTAFTFPNIFRNLLGEGALSGSFVPIFSDYHHEDKDSSWSLLNTTFTFLVTSLVALTVVVLAGVGTALYYGHFPERISSLLKMTMIMFPHVVIVCSLGFMFGIFQYFGYFALTAFSPVLMNIIMTIGIIVSVWIFPDNDSRVFTLSWVVLLSGLFQWSMFSPLVKKIGIPLRPSFSLSHPGIKRVLRLYLPSVFAVSVLEINILFDRIIALMKGPGTASSLYYANRVYQLPLGVFAVAIALASLPEFSRMVSQKNFEGLTEKINYSLKLSLFISIPSAVGLVVLANPIVTAIFQRGAFTAKDTAVTAVALICYSIGLFAFSNVKTLTYAFYAMKNSVTPTKIAFVCMVINIVLNLSLVFRFGAAGIAAATSVAMIINLFLLLRVLGKKLDKNLLRLFVQAAGRFLLMSVIMGIAVGAIYYGLHGYLGKLMTGNRSVYACLGIAVPCGGLVYLGLSYIFNRKEVASLLSR
jgi:putative peptidoglycan lipid II flippase